MREAGDEFFFFQWQTQVVTEYKYRILSQMQFAYIPALLMDYVKEPAICCQFGNQLLKTEFTHANAGVLTFWRLLYP